MKRQDPNNLVGYIRKSLQNHEEPYRLGAWQEFQRHQARKNRRFILKKVTLVAASLLMVSLLSLAWLLADQDMFFTAVEQPPVEINPDPESPAIFEIDRLPEAGPGISMNGITEDRSGFPDTPPGYYVDEEPTEVLPADTEPPVFADSNRNLQTLAGSIDPGSFPGLNSALMAAEAEQVLSAARGRPVVAGGEELIYLNKVEFTSARSKRTAIEAEDKDEIIQLAVYTDRALPGIGEQDLHINNKKTISPPRLGLGYAPQVSMHQSAADFGMGAGIQVDWELATGLYLSSGFYLSQNRLEFNDSQGPELMRTNTENYDNLNNIETAVRLLSVEVPISLKYTIARNVFASVGISTATFLDENYEHRFQYQEEQERVVLSEDGEAQTTMTTVLVTETQSQSEPSFSTFHLPAFYTVSVGYQQQVSDKRTLTVEPFLKVSAGRLATRGIRYSTAGVQMMVSL